jgi:exonuclease III
MSTQHRRKGLLASDSLNGNAWPAAEEYCGQSEADVVLIQEAKVAEADLVDTEATMRAKGWSVSISA